MAAGRESSISPSPPRIYGQGVSRWRTDGKTDMQCICPNAIGGFSWVNYCVYLNFIWSATVKTSLIVDDVLKC